MMEETAEVIERGITLVALGVTVIVLLVLVGVSIGLVFNSDGLLKKTLGTSEKYNQQKAEEALRIVLNDAKIMKYGEEGLTDEKLNEKLNVIGQVDEEDINKVIVDDYIFEIDRNVPKIVDYIGKSDGIIIKYKINGNDNWVKENEVNITVDVTINDNKGKLDASTIKVFQDEKDITDSLNLGEGAFKLQTNKNTKYVVVVNNSEGKQSISRAINVEAKVDKTPPTIENKEIEADRMSIKISATGHDTNKNNQEESGLKQFNYEITTTDGTTVEKGIGSFIVGQTATITVTKEATYIVKVTAEDNVGNKSTEQTKEITVIDGITLKEAKQKVNKNTLRQYLGVKVIDYNPSAGGIWRIFYYDEDGYFGTPKKLYLKTDRSGGNYESTSIYKTSLSGLDLMKKMNPMWEKTSNSNTIDLKSEISVCRMYDKENWTKYTIEGISDFAIGSPSVEMYAKAYNDWKQDDTAIRCTVNNTGYYYTTTYLVSVEPGPNNIFIGGNKWNLSSPSAETINGYNPQIVWVEKRESNYYLRSTEVDWGKSFSLSNSLY